MIYFTVLIVSYSSFTLMMQTGYFLQLILTLAAIASRLNLLLVEISSTLELCQEAFYHLLQILDASELFTDTVG